MRQTAHFWFFRVERPEYLKKVDMLCTLEVATNLNLLREERHVHQLTLSGFRRAWLRISQNRLFRRPGVFHPGTTPQTLSLSRVRLRGSPCAGAQGSLPADHSH